MSKNNSDELFLFEQSNHSVEIFYFFDPFSNECIAMEPIVNKLLIEYRGHVTIKKILAPSLSVLTKCQAQSTSSEDNVALAYKAAEIQGRSKARAFIRYIFNRINPSNTICSKEMIDDCARLSGIDLSTFHEDLHSPTLDAMLKYDLAVFREMDIESLPSMVFFSGDEHTEGVKIEGAYPYHIYTYIINELIDVEIEKKQLPSIIDYIRAHELVSFEELKTIFEWRAGLLLNELKKLRLQRLIEEINVDSQSYYQIKSPVKSIKTKS
ncbi:DsbA family protein [Jeotgalicoccus huakuii]|uniref:DsbA family protein n=1 Tax=Jeotgalicoccus TaxID=227979 RepID=UPI000412ACC2|nr:MULTISPECIES: DsbA family protein [Jeotgalicoccus]MCK1976483.1 DsbA family protein [Jeotgalicoccus huakuii]